MSTQQLFRRHNLEIGGFFKSFSDVKELIIRHGFYALSCNPLSQGIHTSSFNEFAFYHNKEIIYDRLTGLSWQRGGSPRELSYAEASEFIGCLNREKYGGLGLWHIPFLIEAMSLVVPLAQNYDRKCPQSVPLHNSPIFDTTQRWIWTGNIALDGRVWYVQFAKGDCELLKNTGHSYVRAVSYCDPIKSQLEEINQEDFEDVRNTLISRQIVNSTKVCRFCAGTGRQPCPWCQGSGSISRTFRGVYRTTTMTTPCSACGRRGFVSCRGCYGSGQR